MRPLISPALGYRARLPDVRELSLASRVVPLLKPRSALVLTNVPPELACSLKVGGKGRVTYQFEKPARMQAHAVCLVRRLSCCERPDRRDWSGRGTGLAKHRHIVQPVRRGSGSHTWRLTKL
jgi:hypothetical protein